MKHLFLILIFALLTGCNSTNSHVISRPVISTVKPSELINESKVPSWVVKTTELIESNMYVCDVCIGHKVQVHINLNDSGEVTFMKVVRSSGNIELADSALHAITKTQPFNISMLNGEDKEIVKNIIFTFVP